MSAERGSVGEDVSVADDAVVADVTVGHQVIVVTYLSSVILLDAMIYAHVFFEVIVVAYLQWFGLVRGVAKILRHAADGGAVTDSVAGPHAGLSIDPDMAFDYAVGAEHSARFNDAEWTHPDTGVERGTLLDDGAGVNQGHGYQMRNCAMLAVYQTRQRLRGASPRWDPTFSCPSQKAVRSTAGSKVRVKAMGTQWGVQFR